MGFPMKRMMIAGFAGGAAMMIGGALGAVSTHSISSQPKPIVDRDGGVAIDDQITIGDYAGGVDLCVGQRGESNGYENMCYVCRMAQART